MTGELLYPILPCRDLDESTTFYEALGFTVTYRQRRPNPYAVVSRDDIHIHLAGIDGFDPAGSYGSVIIVVPDTDALHAAFAAGLRSAFGKVPSSGIPRLLRPRKKSGTVRGFSVVDPGGNWLRISRIGDTEDDAARERTTGLVRVLENAARLGDAKGDDQHALRILDAGLARFADAPAVDRVRALVYRAELAVRLGDSDGAVASIGEARAIELDPADLTAVEDELAHADELVGAPPRP